MFATFPTPWPRETIWLRWFKLSPNRLAPFLSFRHALHPPRAPLPRPPTSILLGFRTCRGVGSMRAIRAAIEQVTRLWLPTLFLQTRPMPLMLNNTASLGPPISVLNTALSLPLPFTAHPKWLSPGPTPESPILQLVLYRLLPTLHSTLTSPRMTVLSPRANRDRISLSVLCPPPTSPLPPL